MCKLLLFLLQGLLQLQVQILISKLSDFLRQDAQSLCAQLQAEIEGGLQKAAQLWPN